MNYSNFGEFVDERLRILVYIKTYGGMIHPVPDQRSWADDPEEQLQPQSRHFRPSRPKK